MNVVGFCNACREELEQATAKGWLPSIWGLLPEPLNYAVASMLVLMAVFFALYLNGVVASRRVREGVEKAYGPPGQRQPQRRSEPRPRYNGPPLNDTYAPVDDYGDDDSDD